MFFGDEKHYVRPDDTDNPFREGVAVWLGCACCGQALLLKPDDPPFCGGDVATCIDLYRLVN